MTSLMMSLKCINISKRTYCFATAQNEIFLHIVYALLSYAKFGTCLRHPLFKPTPDLARTIPRDGQIINEITHHLPKSQMTLTKMTNQIKSRCQSNL